MRARRWAATIAAIGLIGLTYVASASASTDPFVSGSAAVTYGIEGGRVPYADLESHCHTLSQGTDGSCYGAFGVSVALRELPASSLYQGYFTADLMESFGCPPHQEYPRRHAVIAGAAESFIHNPFDLPLTKPTRANRTGTLTGVFRLNSPLYDGVGPNASLDCIWVNRTAIVIRHLVAHVKVTQASGAIETYSLPVQGTYTAPIWVLLPH